METTEKQKVFILSKDFERLPQDKKDQLLNEYDVERIDTFADHPHNKALMSAKIAELSKSEIIMPITQIYTDSIRYQGGTTRADLKRCEKGQHNYSPVTKECIHCRKEYHENV